MPRRERRRRRRRRRRTKSMSSIKNPILHSTTIIKSIS